MSLSKVADRRMPLLFLLVLLQGLTLAGDLSFPLGTAIWVIYLVPTVIAYSSPYRWLPLVAAAVSTVLIIIGFNFAPDGGDPARAIVNRTLATCVNLLLAGIGYLFVSYRLETRRQQSLREAEAAFSRAVAGEKSMDELGRAILAFMADRFGAAAGLIYVRDGDEYRRLASFGVPSDARVPQVIARDDGFLGEIARQGGVTVLDDVPEGYLTVGSGLGEGKPRRLVLAASGVDDVINCLMEFGFLDVPEARSDDLVDLLNLISGAIGVTIRSGKYRTRVQTLLAETQQQAEELQAQSEELRASNEEMEAQAKLLLQSQSELEEQQAELERSNVQLEEQTSSLEAQRDELARAQSALKAQAKDLEQASRYKSEFLANMSHELRTPLNSLLIMARLLADNRAGNLSAEQVRFAETIETSGNDLLTLINDILDISKIEAGKLELQLRPTRPADILAKMENMFAPAAANKNIGFVIERASDLPDFIESDSGRLEQVLRNFLSNAVKFTENGQVTLRASRSENGLAFAVNDTGPGIAPEQHAAIFEAFRQADGSISRKFGGTGLGLAISRELAGLLGGEISLESAPGEGSTFTFHVPEKYSGPSGVVRAASTGTSMGSTPPRVREIPSQIARVHPAFVEDDRAALSGDSRIILIVEDDPAFARILCDVAHEQQFQCLIAGTADEGALLARQYLPHAVILDMHLPDHTGLSVLDRIKRDARTRHIPVHIVSADHDTHSALQQGAVGYLFKPVSRDDLVGMLENLEARIEQRLRRVLVVEDDAQQAESIRHLLAARDVETVNAHSAVEAIDLLGRETFDCMVLDLNLPDKSGLDLLEQLSTDESVGFPPVIVYTGRDLAPDEEVRLRRYSKSIIVKGAKSPERLLDEVTLFLHQVVAELPGEQQDLIARALERDAVLEGRRILVVEDDVRNIYALTSVLEPHGVNVRIARNGREAIETLEKEADAEHGGIDLALMDVMMPEMDGLTATRLIREQARFANLPIIALTAKATERDQKDCLEAGANDYLAKPLNVEKLLSLVRVWMPR